MTLLPETMTVKARGYDAALKKVCEANGLTFTGTACEGFYQHTRLFAVDNTGTEHCIPYRIKRGSKGHRGEFTVTFGGLET